MKHKFWMVFIVFGLNCLFHFGYDLLPSFITSIFFPVNESIWEHQKMIYTSCCVGCIIEYFIFKVKNNFYFNLAFSGVINVIVFLALYLPFYNMYGEIMIVTFIILFLSIVITQIITYYISNSKEILNKYVCLAILVIIYTIFTLLSYYPITNYLFFDPLKQKYGI